MTRLLLLCVPLFWPLSLIAQDDKNGVLPPTPPYVHMPEDGSRWSVQISPNEESATPSHNTLILAKTSREPVGWEMTLGRNHVGRATITYSDGTEETFYTAHGNILEKCSNSELIALWQPAPHLGSQDMRMIDFPAVEWLSAKCYSGPEKLDRQSCFKFQMAPDFVAWIDQATHFPVKVIKMGKRYIFSTIQPFANEVNLPPNYLAALQKRQNELDLTDVIKRANANSH